MAKGTDLRGMRYPHGPLFVILGFVAGCVMVAVIWWVSPSHVVMEDLYRAKYDSLQMVTERYQLNVAKAMHEADRWHMVADSLARVRVDVKGTVGDARKALNDAGVDSLRAVLMREPR